MLGRCGWPSLISHHSGLSTGGSAAISIRTGPCTTTSTVVLVSAIPVSQEPRVETTAEPMAPLAMHTQERPSSAGKRPTMLGLSVHHVGLRVILLASPPGASCTLNLHCS